MITNQEYLEFTRSTAIYPKEHELEYLTLGLCSEVGEVASKVKKAIRDNNGVVTPSMKKDLIFELADSGWYLTRLCDHFDITLTELLEINFQKLSSRKERGVLSGSGDHR